jgi:transcriptional regulator with XRE-family HTH domain
MNNYNMSKDVTDFGKLCRSYRSRLGLNMTQLSKKIGIKQSTITKIEQGNYPVPFRYIKKSIDIYGIREKSEKMKFLLSCFESIDRFVVPISELGALRREWLSAIFIFGDVKEKNPNGWDDLISWIKDFSYKLEKQKPEFNTLVKSEPI